jgi:hypothetical protein
MEQFTVYVIVGPSEEGLVLIPVLLGVFTISAWWNLDSAL